VTELLSGDSDVLAEMVWFVAGFLAVYVTGRVVVVRFVTRAVRTRNRNNPTIETAVGTHLRVVLIGFGILTGILLAGYGTILSNPAILIAALTFALGIAGQQEFGSLISGMFLVADPEFKVRNWIRWPDGGVPSRSSTSGSPGSARRTASPSRSRTPNS